MGTQNFRPTANAPIRFTDSNQYVITTSLEPTNKNIMRRLLSVFLLLASLQPSISTGRFEDNSLRGRPSRGLQNFFEPFGVGQTQVKYARTSGSAYSKGSHYYRSSSFKSTKEPHKTKSPTTSHPTRAPTVKGSSKLNSRAPTSGKGKGERKRKGGSPTTWYEGLDPQMDPLGDAGDEVSITYGKLYMLSCCRLSIIHHSFTLNIS